jgi:threonine synthase
MSFVSHLEGTASGVHYPADRVMNLDPADGRPVQMSYDLRRLIETRGPSGWYHPERPDMWRFGGLLPLDIDDLDDARHIVTLGEGHTPLIELPDDPLGAPYGIRLALKQDGWPQPGYGANPTQSFKDRGMAMTVSLARRHGLTRLVVPTQGNAGDSLVTYGLAAGLEIAVVMPDDTPMPILGRVAALARQHESIHLDLVQGTIREAGQRMKAEWVPRGFFNVATFQEPGWRIEGKKTLGLEIAEPPAGSDAWSLPDVVVYPTGGGISVVAMWKAFEELECLGLVGPDRPRMIAVQSEATAPLVAAFDAGRPDTEAVEAGHTLAVGLNVPGGVGHCRVLEILRASGGAAVSVSEQAIGQMLRGCFRARHWWLAPEGAAAFAALPALADRRLIRPGERVVVVNTGSCEKYLPDLRDWLL